MLPRDLKYTLSTSGRIVLVGLAPEETLEFERLRWQEAKGINGIADELRFLELYVKQYTAQIDSPAECKTSSAEESNNGAAIVRSRAAAVVPRRQALLPARLLLTAFGLTVVLLVSALLVGSNL